MENWGVNAALSRAHILADASLKALNAGHVQEAEAVLVLLARLLRDIGGRRPV